MNWNDNMTVILMMIAASVLAVIFITVRVAFGQRSVKGGVIAMLAKTLASLGFIMVGIIAISEGVRNNQAAIYFLFGLILGMVGDIVLDLKVVYGGREEEGIYLTSGMVSFGLDHALYLIALLMIPWVKFSVTGDFIGICIAVSVAITAVQILAGIFVMKLNFGKFLVHSIVYAFILTFMGVFTVGLMIKTRNTLMLQPMIGMILFWLSDLALSKMFFGGAQKNSVFCIVNHVLYYAAQICIASFICLL